MGMDSCLRPAGMTDESYLSGYGRGWPNPIYLTNEENKFQDTFQEGSRCALVCSPWAQILRFTQDDTLVTALPSHRLFVQWLSGEV
jgi:hypothetical protein